ncbi:MAG: SGNH/GDSL hydrolase family protein [Elusimicrobiota bacterium]
MSGNQPPGRPFFWRGFFHSLAVSTAGIIAGCLVLEIILRVAGFHFDPYKYYKRFGANFEADDIEYYEQDPALFWKFKPSQTFSAWWVPKAIINSHGFRGPDFSIAKRPGTFRVVCLGDSGTFGWSVSDDETWPSFLRAILSKKAGTRPVEVINLGVPGYSSHQGLVLLRTMVSKMRPNVIIFCYGRNDHNNTVYLTDRQRKSYPRILYAVNNLLLKTRLYQLIYKKATISMYKVTVHHFAVLSERQTVRVPLPDYVDNLRQAAQIAAGLKAQMIFIPRALWPNYNAAAKRVAAEEKDVYIDLSLYPRDRGLIDFMHGEHPGPDVYKRLARLIAERIRIP